MKIQAGNPEGLEEWRMQLLEPLPGKRNPKKPTEDWVASEAEGFDALLAMTGGGV